MAEASVEVFLVGYIYVTFCAVTVLFDCAQHVVPSSTMQMGWPEHRPVVLSFVSEN